MVKRWYAIPNCTPDGRNAFVDEHRIVVSGAPDIIQRSRIIEVYPKGRDGIRAIKLRYMSRIEFKLYLPWMGSAWLRWIKK